MICIEAVREIETQETHIAQEMAISLIKLTKTSEIKKVALIENIRKARNTNKVIEILWNVILSGEKLGTFSSKWNSKFS